MIHQEAKEGFTLYKDIAENSRLFASELNRPDNSTAWAECTIEEKENWEKEHTSDEIDNLDENPIEIE